MENLHPTNPTNSLHQLRRKPLSRALKTSTLRWQWLRVVSATKILDGKFQTIAQQVKAEGRAQGRACSSWTSGHQRNLRKQTLCSKQKLDTVSVFQSRNIATRCSMPRKKSCDSPNDGSWRHTRTDDVSRQFWIMGRIVNHSILINGQNPSGFWRRGELLRLLFIDLCTTREWRLGRR